MSIFYNRLIIICITKRRLAYDVYVHEIGRVFQLQTAQINQRILGDLALPPLPLGIELVDLLALGLDGSLELGDGLLRGVKEGVSREGGQKGYLEINR